MKVSKLANLLLASAVAFEGTAAVDIWPRRHGYRGKCSVTTVTRVSTILKTYRSLSTVCNGRSNSQSESSKTCSTTSKKTIGTSSPGAECTTFTSLDGDMMLWTVSCGGSSSQPGSSKTCSTTSKKTVGTSSPGAECTTFTSLDGDMMLWTVSCGGSSSQPGSSKTCSTTSKKTVGTSSPGAECTTFTSLDGDMMLWTVSCGSGSGSSPTAKPTELINTTTGTDCKTITRDTPEKVILSITCNGVPPAPPKPTLFVNTSTGSNCKTVTKELSDRVELSITCGVPPTGTTNPPKPTEFINTTTGSNCRTKTSDTPDKVLLSVNCDGPTTPKPEVLVNTSTGENCKTVSIDTPDKVLLSITCAGPTGIPSPTINGATKEDLTCPPSTTITMTRSCLDRPPCSSFIRQAMTDKFWDCHCRGASKQATETVYVPARCPGDCSPETYTGWLESGNCGKTIEPTIVTEPPQPSITVASPPTEPSSPYSDDGGYKRYRRI
ncbi:hypothetical protein TWF694_005833 [Orbilia ellipsospora]|uniref:Uncharacterized protein n=1 Tax=Orbilia ellipsospora TaxID=2528407 RepID=A0AAV9WSE2_9PEZI